jgi:adenosine deaminase CECR1
MQYKKQRERAMDREFDMGFESRLSHEPSREELQANKILQRIKELDKSVYRNADSRMDSLGQEHPRFLGDHFLSNVRLIEKTRLFRLLQAMPKGGHLHIHFNANCHPGFLLSIAERMKHMYIWSSKALTDRDAFDQCRIQFSILSDASLRKKNPAGDVDIFSRGYSSYPSQDKGCGWMHYKAFRAQYAKVAASVRGVNPDVDRWLQSKLVFHEEEAHNSLQTSAGLVPRASPLPPYQNYLSQTR